ncbi:MAG TPA: radical SAM protein [Vicinamibacterales bacterium]|nr:radical SAM protein [Vicinamibacterales bacterium]
MSADPTPSLPGYLQIEPVGTCNLRCTMCPIQYRAESAPGHPPALMKYETFLQLVEGFAGLAELHLQGLGEPMMHPRFFEMVRHASSRGIRVTTTSNFTLATPRLAERLLACGLDRLHVSIDGATAETYESIRVRGRFGRLLRNLGAFAAARRRHGRDRPELHLVTVVMRRNLRELPDIVRLARRFDATQVFVQHLCHDFGEPNLPPSYAPMREYVREETLAGEAPEVIELSFDRARQAAAELGVDLRLPNLQPRLYPRGTPGRARCQWPWTGAYVSYQGLAMPCCMISTPDRHNFGSVVDQGVAATWHGSAYQEFRARLDSDSPPEVCRSCALYHGTF